jgi:hypothetical protein
LLAFTYGPFTPGFSYLIEHDEEASEAVLEYLEEQIVRLKDERRLKGPLAAMVNSFFKILDEEKELQVSCQCFFLEGLTKFQAECNIDH